ncbi:MAG TPA: 50S ribosomal protein L22 [Elusimicrobia bacterium]|jgi:large subunit ribosomal protein L22|nr:50S ribosomal protein L22 [Elusimicrobiota bacterium]
MEAIAYARYQRISSRKVAQVLDLVRGKSVEQAYRILKFTPKAARPIVEKTLHSAVSNAGKNVPLGNLYLKRVYVTPGPVLKRFHAGPMGRPMPYKRKTCHLTIVVADKL